MALLFWQGPRVWNLLALFAYRLFARRGRRDVGVHCPICGYDVRATLHGCPECGTELRWGQLP